LTVVGALCENGISVQGMRRIFTDIDDISVDVPSAMTLLEQIISKLKAAGILSDELAAELPSKLALIMLSPTPIDGLTVLSKYEHGRLGG